MKEGELQALVAYRMQRAGEALDEARIMQRIGHWNTCANRLYYAAFYAVSALLVRDGHRATRHSGTKALFNRHYVKPGVVAKEKGRLYISAVRPAAGRGLQRFCVPRLRDD